MSKLKSPCRLEEVNGVSLVTLKGELKIPQAEALKTVLIDAAGSGKPIRIDLSAIENLDVAIIQLLWAVKNKAAQKNLDFDISPISKKGREALKRSGALSEFLPTNGE